MPGESPSPSRRGAGERPVRLRVSGGRGRCSSTSTAPSTRAPNTEKNTWSNAGTCAGSVTNTPRAVQYSRRRAIGRTRVKARAKSAPRTGVAGTPRSCRRLVSAPTSGGRSSSIVSRPKAGASLIRVHEQVEAGGADDVLVVAVLQHRAERHVDGGGREELEQERFEVVVGAVDLVDQQHGRARPGMLERPQ